MSTTIDQKVVEMRFDNAHFERHTRESMSTLDKLKQKLNLTGASKGLESISASANKFNMGGMSNAVDSVTSRFSALEVMGVTALANLTNSAINAGKRMISALTVAPVSDGWKEYEMTMNAIQTTMAGTGKTAEEVEKELQKLDEYADKTVYSTADMLNNLPKFTNAGVELEKATTAMIGIANATALAGGDAGKASIAFYNLGQAIGTGYLTRMDYNSINNAGIATMEWKEQMIQAAIAAGTLVEVEEDLYEAGGKSFTMQQLFIDGLQEQWATTEVMMKVFGDYGDGTTEIGKKAYSAAQDIKTFTMMMESLKATAGTGWKETWQIIFGGLDDAKEFWTNLSNFISNIITRIADFRNNLIRGALTFDPFASLMEKLKSSGFGKAVDNINNISKSLEYYQEMVTKVWRGDYKNQPFRKGLLEDEGHNFSVIQTLVNKGYQYKLTIDDIKETEEQFGITAKETTKNLEDLTDIRLKELGLTDEEIKLYRELERQSKETGKSITDILESMEKRDGRTLLIESLANAGSGLVGVFQALGEAWRNIFMPDDISVLALKLYYTIDAFNRFSENLRLTDKETGKLNETGEKLKRTFEGIFAALDIVLTIVAGPIGIALKVLWQFLKALNPDILGLTASIGDVIVSFRDWIDSILDFSGYFEKLVPRIKEGAKVFKEWLQSLARSGPMKKFIDYLLEARNAVKDFFKNLGYITIDDILLFFQNLGEAIRNAFSNINEHFNGAPADILAGLINGLRNGFVKIKNAIVDIATNIIEWFNKVLGIESPSKVFFAIGGFIVAGLIGGLLAGNTSIRETLSGIASNMADFFNKINWSKVFSAGMSAGLLVLTKKILDIINNVTAPFAGVGKLLFSVSNFVDETSDEIEKILNNTAKVVKSFSKVLNGIAFKHRTEGIKNLAWSILILVGAIVILTKLDIKEMWNAVGVIAALSVILALLALSVSKISETSTQITKGGIKTTGVKTTLLTIGLALLAMATTVKIIGKMNPEQVKQGFLGLIGAVVALGALVAVYGKFVDGPNAQYMKDAGKMMKKMAITLLLMAVVAKIIATMTWADLGKAGAFIAGFALFTAALFGISAIPSKNVNKLGWTMIGIAVALTLMISVVKMASKLEIDEMIKGAAFAAAFVLFVGALTKVTSISSNSQIAKIGGMMLGISVAMILMVGVIKLLSIMDAGALAKGIIGVGLLAGVIAGLLYVVKIFGPEAPKLAGTLLALSISVGILAAIAVVLSLVDTAGLAKGVVAIGILSACMALMIHATKGATDVKGNLIAMTVAVGIMAAAIAVLSFIDWKKLLPATLAMAALMGMFALIANQSRHITGSLSCAIVMAVVLGILATSLFILAKLPSDNLLSAASSLSMLMLSLAGVMFIISKMGTVTVDALYGLLGLVGIIGAMYLVVDILQKMQDIQNAGENAKALGIFMGVLATVQLLCAAAGYIYATSGGMAMLGLVGMAAIIAEVYLILGALKLMSGIPDAISNMRALEEFLVVMAVVLVAVSVFGALAPAGITAMYSLIGLMLVIGALAVAIGALMQEFPAIQDFLDTGIPVLVQLAGAIGEMIGAFVGGILAQVSNSFPEIGANLSLFMDNAKGFIEGSKLIDESVFDGVGVLTRAILALTAADLLSGVASFLTGGSSFADLGTELSAFMMNALPFITSSKLIDPSIMDGVKTLADAVLILTQANVIEGMSRWLTGGNSLADFGSQLSVLGVNLRSFSTNLGTFTDAQVGTINCACEAIKSLAVAATEIPNEGGLWAKLAGDNSLATFAGYLPGLGHSLNGFVINLGTFTKAQVDTVGCAGDAIKTLAEAANEIPNTGGLWASIIGDNSLATFASHLPGLGTNMNGFVTNLGTFTDSQVTTVTCAGNAIKALAEAANNIPNEGGLWAKIVGDNSLATFGEKLPGLATQLKNFVANLGTFTDAQVSTVSSACSALNTIALLGTIDIEDTGDELAGLGKNMVKFAEKVKEFVGNMSEAGSDSITSAINKVNDLINMASSLTGINTESLKNLGESLKDFAKDGVDGFVKEFTDESPKDKVKKGITGIISACVEGLNDNEKTLKTGFNDVLSKAIEALSSQSLLDKAAESGKYVVEGFANGISANTFKAEAQAAAMAAAALKAAKEALQEKSPSRAFYEVGDYAGQGFVNALYDSGKAVYNSAYEMADLANKGLSKAITTVSELIASDIDTQPTIRPVLDLSDVESGAGYLNTMLNNGPSIGVAANLNAISSGMDNRIQNGTNNDVVSAIDKLRRDLGSVGRDTYNINGITYDDGSNITDAVKSLVRAVKVERRV